MKDNGGEGIGFDSICMILVSYLILWLPHSSSIATSSSFGLLADYLNQAKVGLSWLQAQLN